MAPLADPSLFYDNELLDAHYVAGDGRVNENIGLTAVQDIFHSEHDRLLQLTKDLVQGELEQGEHFLRRELGAAGRRPHRADNRCATAIRM